MRENDNNKKIITTNKKNTQIRIFVTLVGSNNLNYVDNRFIEEKPRKSKRFA